ncbi:FAD-dependent oxidoreductase [Pontibacter sp. KCTC 32443]|uniref:phytoene desaturase family protein n=1 Tax=Pontibacter TaxID=323449 RepID=UPI00164E1577|nr:MULTISPECIES: NAD(P)/FAD-dependent oxidoreductase [Pontibacter]MBC5773553.1 FAD-dependent oxidoreductase [Pontibacter sp. KCTC 32443]
MQYDVIIVGSGFGSLSAAALLCKQGLKVCILEQAKYPGGCATSYKRKGYWFETGATTLVGLDKHMPLRYLLDETGIQIPNLRKLETPMQVHLPNGEVVTRYQDLEQWIAEAERVFGKHNQRAFWEHCFKISRQVWQVSLQQLSFPFSHVRDLIKAIGAFRPEQLRMIPAAFRTTEELLSHYNLLNNQLFVDFVNEQLLITAQNYMGEVNELFGATALCYTLYSNYYLDGGLINLVNPVLDFCMGKGATIKYKQEVRSIKFESGKYRVATAKDEFSSRFLISGIPLNNTLDLYNVASVKKKLKKYILPPQKLNGAFTMSLVVRKNEQLASLHHQLHVPEGIPVIGSKSIFISFSHPQDSTRAPEGEQVASVSTHVANPAASYITDKQVIEQTILVKLAQEGLVQRENIISYTSATPGAWIFWTKRASGAVGGYPQFINIKPWQMKDARLDHKGAYVCGDTVYPGQGIAGVCLSGIIAAKKLMADHY